MKTSDAQRHQIIESIMAQRTEGIAETAVNLWEQMEKEIVAIVGITGFNSLFARSIYLAQSSFPWLSNHPLSSQAIQSFEELKSNLEGQSSTQASEANTLLLITFTDILAALIGDQLTTRILRSAWGNDVSVRTDKEFKNE